MKARKRILCWACCTFCGIPWVGETMAASPYSDTISGTPGLVGYWRLGEASGDYADSSGQGNVGVVHGSILHASVGPRPSDGLLGFESDNGGAGFLASDGGDYVRVADPASGVLDPGTGDLSFSLWFKGPADGAEYMYLSKASSSRNGYFLERLDNASGGASNKLNVSMSPNDATPGLGPLGPVLDGSTWTNAVVVLHRNRTAASTDYTSSGVSLFINGVFAGKDVGAGFDGAPGANADNTLPLLIGAYRDGALFNYTGVIDEVAVFNRSLSPAEISSAYNVAVTGIVPEPGSLAALSVVGGLALRRSGARRLK